MQNLPLPNLENVTMIYYDGKLYAFGGGYGEIKPFSQFYCSTDNGLCWRPVTECMAFLQNSVNFIPHIAKLLMCRNSEIGERNIQR